jgi:predicted adenine nucleotide alpha hydrolase (AANH) superfamily ATPase
MRSKNSDESGVKSAYVIALLQGDFAVTGFFYNPNIDTAEEHEGRLVEARKVESILGFPLIAGEYDRDRWSRSVRAFVNEPEKGRRCDICYALRLDRTARLARDRGFPVFTTIMSVSPWKKADVINRIGRRLGAKYGVCFLEADFKKKGGFEKSVELSRRYGLLRQGYCGCAFGRRQAGRPR